MTESQEILHNLECFKHEKNISSSCIVTTNYDAGMLAHVRLDKHFLTCGTFDESAVLN